MDRPLCFAWCQKLIEDHSTWLNGITFHWRCLKKRKAALTVLSRRKLDPLWWVK